MMLSGSHGDHFQAFLDDRAYVDGLADLSIYTMQVELSAWARWLLELGTTWEGVTPDVIRQWLGLHVGFADATMVKKTWVLRSFYAWAHRLQLIDSDPWSTIARPRSIRPWQPRFIPGVAAVERLLTQPDVMTPLGIRDRAILELLYASGLRATELLGLECQQITCGAATRTIHVVGKGRKERIVVYCEPASCWLTYYMRVARPELLLRSGRHSVALRFFIHSSKSGILTYGVFQRLVRRYANAAGLPLVTAHSLRHAFATHLYQGGADLKVIQMLLGHSRLATTCIYARPSTEYLSEFIERHHPRGINYVPLRRARRYCARPRHDESAANDLVPGVKSEPWERLKVQVRDHKARIGDHDRALSQHL